MRDALDEYVKNAQTFDPTAVDSVSVVIPTYNRARCLIRAMRSVLLQTHHNLELIIADDASTDGTEALVRGVNDPRVIYLRQERNLGASAARNLGLAQARGRFIAFHDSDDEWLLDKLERQLALFDNLPKKYGAVFGSKLIYGRDLRYVHGPGRVAIAPETGRPVRSGDVIDQLIEGNLISPQTLLLRASVAREVGGFDSRLPNNNDWDFMLRMAQLTNVHYDPQPVVVDYISEDSIQRNVRGKARSFVIILRKHRALLKRTPRAYAFKTYMLGRYFETLGRPRSATRAYLRSLRSNPWRLKSWAALARAAAGRLLAR